MSENIGTPRHRTMSREEVLRQINKTIIVIEELDIIIVRNRRYYGPEYEDEREYYDSGLASTVMSGSKVVSSSRKSSSKNKYRDADYLLKHLDPINVRIIADVQTDRLYANAPTFAKPIISLSIERMDGKDNALFEQQRDGLPTRDCPKTFSGDPRKVPEKIISTAFQLLLQQQVKEATEAGLDKIALFMKDEKLKEQWSNEAERNAALLEFLNKDSGEVDSRNVTQFPTSSFHVGLFGVDKTTYLPGENAATGDIFLQRIIIDARIANRFLQNPAPMELFTMEALFNIMSVNAVSGRKKSRTSLHLRC